MSTIGALRRLNSCGVGKGRRTVATAIAGSQRGLAFTPAKTTTRLGSYSAGEKCSSFVNSENIFHRREFHSSAQVWKDYPDHQVVPFPALSPTMESGTIAKWEIGEGDEFSAGSVIASIETDKATMDFEAQDDGILAKILKDGPDAIDLPVGTPIAIVVEEPEDAAAFADYVLEEEETVAAAPSSDASVEASPVAAAPAPVVGGSVGTSLLLPSARFLAESKYVELSTLVNQFSPMHFGGKLIWWQFFIELLERVFHFDFIFEVPHILFSNFVIFTVVLMQLGWKELERVVELPREM